MVSFPFSLIFFVDLFWHDYSGYTIQKRLSVKIKVTIVTIVTFLIHKNEFSPLLTLRAFGVTHSRYLEELSIYVSLNNYLFKKNPG